MIVTNGLHMNNIFRVTIMNILNLNSVKIGTVTLGGYRIGIGQLECVVVKALEKGSGCPLSCWIWGSSQCPRTRTEAARVAEMRH